VNRLPGYMPVSKPYEMTDLVYDLVLFARHMLVPGGRLVFFLPTVTEDWDDLDVPTVEGMKEIKFCSGSSQDFGRWSRRVSSTVAWRFSIGRIYSSHLTCSLSTQLITMEKIDKTTYPRPDFLPVELEKLPGHHKFPQRFAEGFDSRARPS
jgi:tRNA (guanine10-N2)-methyltransferase